MSAAGTGEQQESSDSEGGGGIQVYLERLTTVSSTAPYHPPNYPAQRIRVFTATASILIEVAGFNQHLTDQNLLTIARRILNDPTTRR